MMESFSKRIQRLMGDALPESVPRGVWPQNKKEYPHICKNLRDNFIDGVFPEDADIKGSLSNSKIKYHRYANHLNSSQVMCISFFKKFFEADENNAYLLKLLKCQGLSIDETSNITNATFEYEPDANERTNFDFYLILSDGRKISMEIKYTESEFGGISLDENDPDKYKNKWKNVYCKLIEGSPYVSKISEEDFEKNYQINRNIAYARGEDIVIFLTPKANDSSGIKEGREYIDSFNSQNILNLYWEDMVRDTLELVSDKKDLLEYYEAFYQKYILILGLR